MKQFWRQDRPDTTLKVRVRELLEKEQKDLRELRVMMGKASNIIGDFSFAKKGSWPGFAERVLGAVIDGSGLFQGVLAYMEANGRVRIAEDIPIAMHQFGLSQEDTKVFENNGVRAMAYVTVCGAKFWAVHYGGERADWDLYVQDATESERVYDHLSARLWGDHRAIRVDLKDGVGEYDDSEVTLEPIALGPQHTYVGELAECITQWKAFVALGVRRNILLQGKPGCGKSTLCLHAARELSQRCALVTSRVYSEYGDAEWGVLMRLLSPHMLILDDIDRVGSLILGKKLALFEENKTHEVPVVMFTSNDIREIPEAFRRPGRIDQILVVQEPDDDVRRAMISSWAGKAGLNHVPDEKWPRLLEVLHTLSGAHVVEMLRRAKTLGWDASLCSADITFTVQKRED